MSVLRVIGPKCTLAALHAAPLVSHVEYAPRALLRKMGLTDRQTVTDASYIALSATRGRRNNATFVRTS